MIYMKPRLRSATKKIQSGYKNGRKIVIEGKAENHYIGLPADRAALDYLTITLELLICHDAWLKSDIVCYHVAISSSSVS